MLQSSYKFAKDTLLACNKSDNAMLIACYEFYECFNGVLQAC